MKCLAKNNKGLTLIELISAIAILSIVAISAFTLLMFSIRSNNVIVTGASAAQDADLLNKRLELLFAESTGVASQENEGMYVVTSGEVDNLLVFENGTLSYEEEIWQENLNTFVVEKIDETNLVRVSYTIGSRNFSKLFRLNTQVQ